jgi:hypothetical protein
MLIMSSPSAKAIHHQPMRKRGLSEEGSRERAGGAGDRELDTLRRPLFGSSFVAISSPFAAVRRNAWVSVAPDPVQRVGPPLPDARRRRS